MCCDRQGIGVRWWRKVVLGLVVAPAGKVRAVN
jgi:hypothetical protein